jgi:hypothetical protein
MTTSFAPATGLLASLDLLQVSIGGLVLHVRLNRPAKRNALSDTESLMAAVAESTPEAQDRLRAFLEGRAGKVVKAS